MSCRCQSSRQASRQCCLKAPAQVKEFLGGCGCTCVWWVAWVCIYVCSMCVHECGSRIYGVYICSVFGVWVCTCVGYMACAIYMWACLWAFVYVVHICLYNVCCAVCVKLYVCGYVHAYVLCMYVHMWGWCRFRNWTFWNFCWQFLRVPEAACPRFVFLGSFPADSQCEALPSMLFSCGLFEAGCWQSAFGYMVCVSLFCAYKTRVPGQCCN